ncbi:MAG: ribokinase [Spirochaetales bacterium]|jgi:ribokinase|nr:ribokinase [Spirochaetales bacterium]
MKILNMGSLNIDHVYQVEHFVRPGETLGSQGYQRFCGGKGLNQSIALALAGAKVFHAGKIGADGLFLKERLAKAGVDTTWVLQQGSPTGHAVIQVTPQGENAILLFPGANHSWTPQEINRIIGNFMVGDILLLQNEINGLGEIIEQAAARNLLIALNPSPLDRNLLSLPLEKVGILILNEVEGEGLTGEIEPSGILGVLRERFPKSQIVLTLGAGGVMYSGEQGILAKAAKKAQAIDTTAAGDTFTGYFLAALAMGKAPDEALDEAILAAAIAVTRPGAADSIPRREELEQGFKQMT